MRQQPRYSGERGTIGRACGFCGRVRLWPRAIVFGRGGGKHCSRDCRVAAQRRDAAANFEARITERIDRSDPEGCWPWTSYHQGGYPALFYLGKNVRVHRLVLERKLGRALGPDEQACHTCDNPSCCRADHLFEGTSADNQADKARKGRGRRFRGERSATSKLTNFDVITIRAAYATGRVGQEYLAERFGVGKMEISRIVRRQRWAHIE